ncbi:MAG: ribulose-phosphate 3-epimerase [Treponemataceae bacterium]|nr:ribulose-phosphate 3-epimerase [Treponemataceae bacterium]
MKKTLLAPSLLSSDFSALGAAVAEIEKRGGKIVHIDVMDGSFVPNITIGQPVVASLRRHSELPFDVHLMVLHPESQIDSFVEAGADMITFHYEACVHHHRVVQQIHAAGKKAGISIVPSTPVSVLKELLPFVDLVLVMTVNPGFGGQVLIPECLTKVRELDDIRKKMGYNYLISVDGGINESTFRDAVDAGSDILVSGSAFFSGRLDGESLEKI